MSILRDRIATQAREMPAYSGHPPGTSATPMQMPMSERAYDGNMALYGTLHPLITADGAVVATRSHAATEQVYAEVYPAGRP